MVKPSALSRFPVKLICVIYFGLASCACCLLQLAYNVFEIKMIQQPVLSWSPWSVAIFEFYHMFLHHFFIGRAKKFCPSNTTL